MSTLQNAVVSFDLLYKVGPLKGDLAVPKAVHEVRLEYSFIALDYALKVLDYALKVLDFAFKIRYPSFLCEHINGVY